MRCDKCNVDLPESYTRCPLCGSKPVDCEAKIKGMNAVDYSDRKAMPSEAVKAEKTAFSFEKIKAYFNL